ncbi:MAG: hypothetical protein ACRDAP_11205, partial [Shewanella sp.]
ISVDWPWQSQVLIEEEIPLIQTVINHFLVKVLPKNLYLYEKELGKTPGQDHERFLFKSLQLLTPKSVV